MNAFKRKLMDHGYLEINAETISILCVLIGYRCNLRCTHCYLDASPERTEEMSLETINKILDVLEKHKEISTVELTGGEPLLNPHFPYFVESLARINKKIMVASNLTVCCEPGMEYIPGLLAANRVKIYASLPSYSEEDVDRQRGRGTFKKVISVLKVLNELGYGEEGTSLELEIEFNPSGAATAPDRLTLEKIYREKLKDLFGITFNNLIVLNNAPLGRLRKKMSGSDLDSYMKELEDKFNPDTVDGMMCRHMLTVSHDGKLYDCGFLQKIGVQVKNGHNSIDDFDYEALSSREIAANPVCFVCTAGGGLSCFPGGMS